MSLPSDVRIALRGLARSPGFVVAAVASLGLAIGASIAAFSIIDTIRFRELPFPAANRLVVFGESPANEPDARLHSCNRSCSVRYETWDGVIRMHPFRSLDAVAGFTSGAKSYSTGTDAVLLNGSIVTPNVFDLLETRPVLGRAFTPDDNRLGVPLVVILSHGMWQTYFGADPAIVGRDIKLSDSHYTVVGVMPAGFQFEVNADFWLPAVPTLDPSTRPSIRSLQVIGRLRPGETIERLRSELTSIDVPVFASSGDATATTLGASGLRTRYASSAASRDLVFGALVACILLIACANLANLILVRALRQRREHAVRAALGADTNRLVRPVLVQTSTLVLLATGVGIAIAVSSLGILRSLSSLTVLLPGGMDYRVDGRVLAVAAGISLLTMVIVSILPVRLAARGNAQDVLRGDSRAGGDSAGLHVRQAFVVAQVACATVLLTQAFLITGTVLRMGRVDPGYDMTRILTASPSFPHTWRVPSTYIPLVARLRSELGRLPGVYAVAVRSAVALSARDDTPRITIDGNSQLAANALPDVAYAISPGYFDVIGVPLVLGREFDSREMNGGAPVAIVNHRAASAWWPNESPIGKSLRLTVAGAEPASLTVIGVARDNRAARGNQLLEDDGAEVYVPYAQFPSAFPLFLVRSPGDPALLIRPVRQLVTQLVPDRPLFTATAIASVDRQLGSAQSNAMQIGAFALVGLLLAVIGVYGLLAFETSRRTREIGIRSALGASRGSIVGAILFNTVRLSIIGVVLGFPATVGVTRLLRDVLAPDSTANPGVYLLVSAGIIVVSLLASYAPARRASRVDPLIAMRVD